MKKFMTLALALIVGATMSFVSFGEEASAAAGNIGAAKAKSIALKNAKLTKGKVRAYKMEFDDEERVYEIEFIKKKNRAEYEYEIASTNGKILKKSVDYKYKKSRSKKKIGKVKARKKVAKFTKTKYSIVKRGTCKFDYERYGSTYDVKFKKGKYKYDCEVLARNGKVIEMSYEYIGR